MARLLSAMKKLTREVNDQEICRRLEILINSEKEDLPPSSVKSLLEEPGDFDPSTVSEPYTQYVKHYLYMVKREERNREKQRQETESRKQARATKKRPSASTKKSSKKSPPSASAKKKAASGRAKRAGTS
ncbi:MAG: hypothetical protein KDK37_05105 [Leptospiraceae bacterium]|nr:hypothetical protein [Leptospiraceae bacterium]MCB1303628.1 hypothetical protein [Leptospiraceae bacterium]